MLLQSAGTRRPRRARRRHGRRSSPHARRTRAGAAIKFLGRSRRRTRPPIYSDDLPLWAQQPGPAHRIRPLPSELAARGIRMVDLRPALAAGDGGREGLSHNDSHWTAARGARRLQRDRRRRRPPRTGTSIRMPPSGRMVTRTSAATSRGSSASTNEVSETTEALRLTAPGSDEAAFRRAACPTTWYDRPAAGRRCLSSATPSPPSLHHHPRCSTSRARSGSTTSAAASTGSAIDGYHPDEVWWMPAERFLNCDPTPGPRPRARPGALERMSTAAIRSGQGPP